LNSRKFSLVPYLFTAPALTVFALMVLLPLAMTVVYSFMDWKGYGAMTPVGLDNYARALADPIYLKSYRNVAVYIALTIVLEVAVGLAMAGLISARLRGAAYYRTAFFTPVMLPMVVVGYLWIFVYNPEFGLVNSLLRLAGLEAWTRVWLGDPKTALIAISIVSGWVFAGFYMTIFYMAIQRIPREIYETAYVDGVGEFRLFWKIKVPLIRGMIGVSLLLCIMGAFQGFDLFYIMTNGGPYHATEIVTTYLVKVVFQRMNVGYGAALAVILTLIVIVIGVLFSLLRRKERNELEY